MNPVPFIYGVVIPVIADPLMSINPKFMELMTVLICSWIYQLWNDCLANYQKPTAKLNRQLVILLQTIQMTYHIFVQALLQFLSIKILPAPKITP